MENPIAYFLGQGHCSSHEFEEIVSENSESKEKFCTPFGDNFLTISKINQKQAQVLSKSTGCIISPYTPSYKSYPRDGYTTNIYLKFLKDDVRQNVEDMLMKLKNIGYIDYRIVNFKIGCIVIFDRYLSTDVKLITKKILVQSFPKDELMAVWARKKTVQTEIKN